MNPFVIVGSALLLAGKRGKNRGKRSKRGVGTRAAPRRSAPTRMRKPKPKPKYAKQGNGRIKQTWTSFPWQPDRVTDVAQELLEKGESDPDRLTLAVAKTIYPVHPVTGMEFPWPPSVRDGDRDVGATMIYKRIRLRVNTLLAGHEERMADEATAHVDDQEPEPEEIDEPDESEDVDDDDGEQDAEEEDHEPDTPSPRIGRATPMPTEQPAQTESRRPLTLKRRRVMRRRPDPYAYHPADNQVAHGVFHTVEDGETIHGIAREALSAIGQPSEQDVAQYVSLIVCSPANDLPTVWDDEHELPGADPAPWGYDRPTLWLPKLNATSLAAGVVTTLGVSWPDGSNGITPPPGASPRG